LIWSRFWTWRLSRPLAKLTSESQWFVALEHESDELEELSMAVEEVIDNWSRWPEDEFGTTLCEGPSVSSLERLQAAIEAVLAMDDDDEQPERVA